jgi:hypothetical protein
MRMGLRAFTIAAWMSLIGAAPALADVTLFIGTTTTPANRQVRGFSAGLGLLIVAFEFEYSSTHEDLADVAPSLKTGVGNVLLQTPFAIHGVQPYFTTGAGCIQHRRRCQDIVGWASAVATGLSDLQTGQRSAEHAVTALLCRTQSEILS